MEEKAVETTKVMIQLKTKMLLALKTTGLHHPQLLSGEDLGEGVGGVADKSKLSEGVTGINKWSLVLSTA